MSDIQKGVQAFERLLKTDEGVKTGTCRKCGGGGHLTFECRNMFKLDDKAKKPKRASRFGFIKGRLGSAAGSPTSQTLDKPEAAASPVSTPPLPTVEIEIEIEIIAFFLPVSVSIAVEFRVQV
ncbi:hypothetical protein DFQ27_006068 [Actinomortierella ambigua]|uniref:CCHC-type domain-containing protein n=1 Tax=Actinomortierella ambigua TaxID=1343610 RepID=A0A9P6PZ58_9FUNG|nr:hypothetical protein DFQ27_006068 [Actinomortierella ambigua]